MYQLPSKPAVVRNITMHSYRGYLTTIAVLLAIIAIGLFGSRFDLNQPSSKQFDQASMFSFTSSNDNSVTKETDIFPTINQDNHQVAIDLPEELPFQKFASEKELKAEYNNGTLHVWYEKTNPGSYQLQIEDNGNKIVMYDGDRVVHIFDRRQSPNCQLFNQIDRDNE